MIRVFEPLLGHIEKKYINESINKGFVSSSGPSVYNFENKWAKYDTGAASENICLQSTYMGLAAHQMGGFDSEKIRNLANIPVEFDVISFIAIGKPLSKDMMTIEQAEAEGASRKRLQLSEIYFENKWDNL